MDVEKDPNMSEGRTHENTVSMNTMRSIDK